jgi:dTMP kinase
VDAIRAVNEFATGGLTPDRTVLLRVDVATGRARQADRGAPPDRLEREDGEFFAAVARVYEELAAGAPDRIRVVDAEGPPDEVAAAVLAAVEDLLS